MIDKIQIYVSHKGPKNNIKRITTYEISDVDKYYIRRDKAEKANIADKQWRGRIEKAIKELDLKTKSLGEKYGNYMRHWPATASATLLEIEATRRGVTALLKEDSNNP